MKSIAIISLLGFLVSGCSPQGPSLADEPKIQNPEEIAGNNVGNNEDTGNNMTNPFNFETKTVKLNSGWEMPIIGIGTYLLSTSQAEESVYNALKVGMRLIDTADIYGNEVGVGRGMARAMKDFGIKREEIFVTSKLWTSEFANADKEIDERLQRLGLDYVDLLLLHHAAPNDVHAYLAMEQGVKDGKIHSIGISNFYQDDVDRIMEVVTIKPAVLQNETHPYRQSKDMKAYIAPLGTILESWFPLGGRGTGIRTLNSLDVIKDIAAVHRKSTYQVLLRWHLQSGVIAIPGSSNAAHIAENYDIFDFALTEGEMAKIDALERNHRFASY